MYRLVGSWLVMSSNATQEKNQSHWKYRLMESWLVMSSYSMLPEN
jgi:hypothetical protein